MAPYNKLRVELHIEKGRSPVKKQLVAVLANSLGVRVQRVIETPTKWAVICSNAGEVDALTSTRGRQKLATLGLTPRAAAEHMAQKSIICHRVDDSFFDAHVQDIIEEIEAGQDWAKVEDVTGITDSTIKIIFTERGMVQKALKWGVRAFHMIIAPSQIARERYQSLLRCLRCYQIEDHRTENCKEKIICNNCGRPDHIRRECPNETCCKFCGGSHLATTMSCPTRREKAKEKRQKSTPPPPRKEKIVPPPTIKKAGIAPKSYAEATAGETQPATSSDEAREILVCVLHAHTVNTAVPGSYAKTLNEMLVRNGLTKRELWFPENPPNPNLRLLGQNEAKKEDPINLKTREKSPPQVRDSPPNRAIEDNEAPRPPATQKRSASPPEETEKEKKLTRREKNIAEEADIRIYYPITKPFPAEDPVKGETIFDLVSTSSIKWRYRSVERKHVETDLILGEIEIPRKRCLPLTENDFEALESANEANFED